MKRLVMQQTVEAGMTKREKEKNDDKSNFRSWISTNGKSSS